MSNSKIREQIKNTLQATQIAIGQLDPNGYCNVGCWYCPVRYEGNPEQYRQHMPVALLEKILLDIISEKGQTVSKDFCYFYTAHYNEILLYKYLPEMLELFRKYGLYSVVLSNGLTLSKKRSDLIYEYRDVICGVCLNIPAASAELWAKAVNQPVKNFSSLCANIDYFCEKFNIVAGEKYLSLQVNGIDPTYSAYKIITDSTTTTSEEQLNLFRQKWPQINSYAITWLSDRAGLLDQHRIITHQANFNHKQPPKQIIGCENTEINGYGRPYSWIHINAKGDLFLCCDDYKIEYTFGNLAENTLREIWLSEQHVDMIERAFSDICTRCTYAKYE